MSLELYAYLKRENVPDRLQWQRVIDSFGFEFSLDESLVAFEDSGFLPCRLRGEDSGFEIYYEEDIEPLLPPDDIATSNVCVSFRWGSRMAELASVMIASAALAKLGATVYFENEGEVLSEDDLLRDAEEALEALK